MEDDLIISSDFTSFFHQTSTFLDTDPSVYAVSAHRKHSRAGFRLDPALLLRGDAVPQWGWMARKDIINDWVAPGSGFYWDYHLLYKGKAHRRHTVYPQLSRSLHGGSGGSNVRGFSQAKNPYEEVANILPDVHFLNIDRLNQADYASDFTASISQALALPLTNPTPCEQGFIPTGQRGPFIIFVYDDDDYTAVVNCLNGFTTYETVDHREEYDDVLQMDLQQGVLYVVNCPESPYCSLKPTDYPVVKLGEEFLKAATALKTFKRHWRLRQMVRLRSSTNIPEKHFQLINFDKAYTVLGLDLTNYYECNGVHLPNEHNVHVKERVYNGDSNSSNGHVHELSKDDSHDKQRYYYTTWDCPGPTAGSDSLLHMPHNVSTALKHMARLAYQHHFPKPQIHEFNLNQYYTWSTDNDPRFEIK
ncbi:unnamed protein product [Meganyctiphanes norvegica]|uniref:Alpha-1,3-mannosyl-glycoprotein 2-beta-N-acetylglucosaminyltransferase n=1 Tax=Meganyctiphanes norvegica TaxID=48144 RepID=A0AAV2Q3C1_MEGNR